jgi:hypothetical protein
VLAGSVVLKDCPFSCYTAICDRIERAIKPSTPFAGHRIMP